MSHTRLRFPRPLLWPLLLAWLIALPALGASLKPDKTEIAVGEEVVVSIAGKPFIAVVTDWSAGEGLQLLDSDSDGARFKGTKAGDPQVKVKINGKTYKTVIKVLGKPGDKDDGLMIKLEGLVRTLGIPGDAAKQARIARLLYEVTNEIRGADSFYKELGDMGAKMTDVIALRSKLVDMPDSALARQIMGPGYPEGGTLVEQRILTWRKQQTLEAIKDVLAKFSGRVPADGVKLIVSHVGKWATQDSRSLQFPGDIDFSFVSNDVALAQELRSQFLEVIKQRTRMDQISIDAVCTAHGKAGLEVYIGRHGMKFAEDMMNVNQIVDLEKGTRRQAGLQEVAEVLTQERAMLEAQGKEAPQPAHNTEPGLSMEMVRHFDHDIAKSGIFDVTNAVVKAAKYLDRSYKSLEKTGGTPADAKLADFAKQITAWANAKPQTAQIREDMIRLISEQLGSPPRTVWDADSQKLVLDLDPATIKAFHDSATQAMWKTVEQGSNTRTAEMDTRLRDLLDRQRRGDKVDEDVAKLRQDMVDLVDMVEAEVKAIHGGMDIPIAVLTNNAKVRSLLVTLSQRFGIKALSAEELKDKNFVEELLKAQLDSPNRTRAELVKAYIMDRAARAAELSMTGVEKTNQFLDIIDDGLLGSLRGDADFADFEAEMKNIRQASIDPNGKQQAVSRLSVLKGKVANGIKGTNQFFNKGLQATAAGRQGMKFMAVYGLVDEMQAYRDAFNEQGWGGFATEIFRRRIPLGSAVESVVMGNTYRAGWDVVTTLIPPLGLPEAAYGLGTMIGTQARSTYWNEQLALFTDGLYADAIFKLEEVQSYEGAKVGAYRLVRTFHNNMPLDLHRFAEMRKDQVEALAKEVEAGHVNWQAYKNNFNGLTEWLDVDATLKANLAASDPALQLLEEMANHPAVGKLLLDRLAEKGLARWEQVKLGFITKLIKRLEDRKQADDALGRGMLPDLFAELRKVAADLGIEDEVMKGLDAEVDTSNLKVLVNWLWDTKRSALGQAPTESETTRAAQAVKKYLDVYKQVQAMRDQAAGQLTKAAVSDVNTRYLTSNLFLSGRADSDLAAARAWLNHIETARKAMVSALLAIKRGFLPKAGLDSNDQPYLDRAFGHELWIKPYQDGNAKLKKAWMLDYANGHIKERDKVLAEYKDWLTKLGPVQLTVTAVDAKDSKKSVLGLRIALTPTDELGKPVSAGAAGNQVVLGVPMGRYRLVANAPGYLETSRNVVYGRGLSATPSETVSLTPSGKDPDKDKDKDADKDGKPDATTGTDATTDDKTGLALPGPAKQGAGGSASGQFPGEPFNGMQISYSFSGCSLPEMKDSPGFTTSRSYKGRLGSGSMTVSGTARMGAGYGATLSVSVSAGGEHKEHTAYIKSGFPGFNTNSFSLTIPIPATATSGGFGIRMSGEYNAGGRGLVVSGSCSADGPEGVAPKGTDELDVSISGPTQPVPLGKEAEVTAQAKGGRFPYTFAWTGATGSAERAKAKIVRPGTQQVAVTVNDSEGKRAGANLTIKVAPLKLELAGLPNQAYYGGNSRLQVNGLPDFQPAADPCAGREYTGSNPFDECLKIRNIQSVKSVSPSGVPPPEVTAADVRTTATHATYANPEGKEGAYRFVWQSEPGLTFDLPTSTDGATTVTFDRMGQVKVWCEVHQMIEGAWQTIGETDQKTVNVVAPAFSLNFDPADGQGKVGQEVRAKVVAKPDVPAKLIDYRWLDPASNRMEYTENASEIGFKVKDAKPIALKALARVPHYGDQIAEISGSYTGVVYDVKIGEPKGYGPQLQVWVCDTQLGNAKNCGMKDIPKGQFVTFQDIFLKAEVTPAPPSPRYRWSVDPAGSCGLPGAGSELKLNCSSTGTYTVRLQVLDADNLLLGQAESAVSVSVNDNDVKQAPKSKEANDKMQQAKQQANDGQLDQAIGLAGAAAGLDPKNGEAKDLGKRWNDERQTVRQQLDRAKKALQSNKPDDAQKEIDAAKKLHPKYPPVLDAEKQIADKRKSQGQTVTGKPPVETTATPTTPAIIAAQPVDLSAVGGKKAAPREVRRVTVDDNSWIRFKSTDEKRLSLNIPIATPIWAKAVAVVSNLDDATYLEQGKTIARITVLKDSGDETLDIQAGVHTSEWNYGTGPKHARFNAGDIGDNRFLAVLPLARPGIVRGLKIDYVETGAPKWSGHAPGFCLRGISLVQNTEGITLTPSSGGMSTSSNVSEGDWAVVETTPGMYHLDQITGQVKIARQGNNPGGLQHAGLRLNRGLPESGDFDAQVSFSDARIEGGLNQIELHATFADGSIFFVVRDREGSGSHIWAPGLQGNQPCGRAGTLRMERRGETVTGYCDGKAIWSAPRKSPLTGLQFVLQNNGSNDPISATFRDWRFNAAAGTIQQANASGLAGTWSINANNYTGKIEFNESGGKLSGRVWFDAHQVWEDLRDISFDGRTLRFLRPGPSQHYTGTLTGNEVRGTFDGGGSWNWFITRVSGSSTFQTPPPEDGSRPANSKLVLEDDKGPYQWVEGTEVQTQQIHAGRAAFRSTGNNHFTHRLGIVGNYADQYRYLDFWIYLKNPSADIQLQAQVDGTWGKRWGFDGDATYNGYGWAMEGTTAGLPSGRWLHQRLDLMQQLHIDAGQTLTGLAFSSDGGDVYYDSVYLIPGGATTSLPQGTLSGKRVLEDDAGPYSWVEPTSVQKEVVAHGKAAFRSTGNNHFAGADLGVVGDYPEQFRNLNFWLFPIGAEADLQLQVQVDGVWGKRWGYDAGPKYNGYGWTMEGTTTGLKPGQWQEVSVDLLNQLHINPGQKITGLAFSSDNGDVYYDSVYLHPNPSPALKPAFQPVGKRVLEDDAGGFNWADASELQDYLVFHGSRAFRSNGNDHFLADLGVAGNGSGQFRSLGFWAFFMGPEADLQVQVQVNGSWGKRWGYDAGPKYNGYDWTMEGTTTGMANGRWTWVQADLLNQLHLKAGDRITGLAFSSDNADVAYDSVYLLPSGTGPSIAAGSQTGSAGAQSGTGGSLRLDRTVYAPGESIAVHFTAPGTWARDAWVGIVPSAIPHGDERQNDNHDITYQYLDKRTSGTLTFTAPAAGNWDFRLHDTDNNGKEQASVSFRVDAAVVPGGRDYTGYDSPIAAPDSRSGSGYLRIEACVDGSDWISLDNGRLNHQHRAFDQIGTHGGCPASHRVAGGGFLVDGLAVGLARLPLPVGIAGIGRFEVERGRGKVRLDGANRILIDDDGQGGSDVYIIRVYPSAAATGTPAGATVPGGRDYTAAPLQGQLIFEVGNIGGVGNGPAKATIFTLTAPHVITLIRDYHWNSARGATPGSIALKGKDGSSHGPWQANGSPGQGGAPNAYWTAYPNVTLPAGTYTVIDSDPTTWSHNAESNNRGFVRVEGYPADSGQSTSLPTTGNAQVDGAIKEVDGLLDAVKSLKGLFGK